MFAMTDLGRTALTTVPLLPGSAAQTGIIPYDARRISVSYIKTCGISQPTCFITCSLLKDKWNDETACLLISLHHSTYTLTLPLELYNLVLSCLRGLYASIGGRCAPGYETLLSVGEINPGVYGEVAIKRLNPFHDS